MGLQAHGKSLPIWGFSPGLSRATQHPSAASRGIPTDISICTARVRLRARARGAYSSCMARADCPICQGSGWKVVERSAEGAQALASANDSPGAAAGEPEDGVGGTVRLHHGRQDRARAREGARARPLSPLRLRKFRDRQRNRECLARAAGCLESQPRAGEADGAAIRRRRFLACATCRTSRACC